MGISIHAFGDQIVYCEAPISIVGCITTIIVVVVRPSTGASSGAINILGLVFAEAPIGIVGCTMTTPVVMVHPSAGASSGAFILWPSLYLCSIQLVCVVIVHHKEKQFIL